MFPKSTHRRSAVASGFTLIELLVTVTILMVLVAILIPNLRTVTKDRNIREAARVVGSMFSQASQRAISDGVAGVILYRNPNVIQDTDGVAGPSPGDFQYTVNTLALMRRVPPFAGDQLNSLASLDTTFTAVPGQTAVQIVKPLEQDDLGLIVPGDYISFNNSPTKYRIDLVENLGTNDLRLLISHGVYPDPTPLLTVVRPGPVTGVQYLIHRAPRILDSSVVTLPAGYHIDLRFSGFNTNDSWRTNLTDGFPTTVFEPEPKENNAGTIAYINRPIAIVFDGSGSLERMLQRSVAGGVSISHQSNPQGPLFLFVTEAELDDTNPLARDANLWVSVSNGSGAVNIGYNSPAAVNELTLADLGALYNGDAAQRQTFNNAINEARSNSQLGSAAQ